MTASFPPPLPNLFSGVTTQAGAMTTLGLTAANNFGMVVGSPTGGNMGAGTINATALYVNGTAVGSTSTAAITSGVINGATIGGTTPATGAFTSVNSTGGTYSFNGVASLAIIGASNTNNATVFGSLAGQAVPSTNGFAVYIGANAGQFSTGGENTHIGNLAGVFSISGHQNAYVGTGAAWTEQSSYNVAIGSDCYRATVSSQAAGQNTAVGQNAMRSGSGYSNTAIGQNAMVGTSTTIAFSGTQTTGDVVSLIVNAPVSSVYGFPAVVNQHISVTVTAGMTSAQLATAFVTQLMANLPTLLPNMGTQAAGGGTVNYVVLTFAGSAISGCNCVITSSVSGAATEVVTITPGFTGNNNLALGCNAMVGTNMQTASNNIAAGQNSLTSLTSGASNVCIGQNTGTLLTTGSGSVIIGSLAGAAATTTNYMVAIGSQALASSTSATFYDTAIGTFAMQNYAGTGSGEPSVAVGGMALQGASGATFYAGVAIGYQAGKLVSSAGNLTLVGYNTGSKITTGGSNTVIGANVASTTLVTGAGNILIGASASVDTPTSSTNYYLNIGGVLLSTGLNTASTAIVASSFGLGVGGTSGPTWTSGTGAPSATQPNGSMYSRGDGTTGTRMYVSSGGGTWLPVAGV